MYGLVWAFHFVVDALGEFFDFIRFLDHFERENVLIGFVNVFLELERELEQPVSVGLQRSDALLGGFLLHVARDASMSFVFVERMVDVWLRMRNGLLSECGIAKEEQQKSKYAKSESHGNLAESWRALLSEIIRLTTR